MQLEILAVVVTIVLACMISVPVGLYMARVFAGEGTWLDPLFVPVERSVLRLSTAHAVEQQDWRAYAQSLVVSNAWMWLVGFTIVSIQSYLPLNPDGIPSMEATLAFKYHLQFRHQYEFAALQRRDRAVVSVANAGDHVPAVCNCGYGHGRAHRDHPGAWWQSIDDTWQLLSLIARELPSACCCHSR